MKNSIYWSDDYAGAEGAGIEFYYGYEKTKNGSWCFVAKVKGAPTEFVLTSEELEKLINDVDNLREPVHYLLAGIIAYTNRRYEELSK